MCMYMCMHMCMYMCMHMCMYMGMYMCMYMCMYMWVYMCMYMGMGIKKLVCIQSKDKECRLWIISSQTYNHNRNSKTIMTFFASMTWHDMKPPGEGGKCRSSSNSEDFLKIAL